MIWLTFGTILVSLVATHAWWSVVRVVRLRQDLFDMRDDLFDVAASTRTFADPAYRDARRHMNSVARIADSISIPLLGRILQADPGVRVRPKSNNAELQDAIDRALEDCTQRIVTYLLRETFTGLVVLPLVRALHIGALMEEQVRRWIRRWLISSSPESLDCARRGVLIHAK